MVTKKQHTYQITHSSEEDGIEYTGQFTVKKLTIMDRSKINIKRTQLNGGYSVVRNDNGDPTGEGADASTDSFNYMLAYLETALIQKPKWWDLNEITDIEVLNKVFEEAMKFENSFRKRSVEGSEANSGSQSKETHSGDSAKKVVDEEVRNSLDG